MSCDFVSANNPFFKHGVDKICIICSHQLKIDQTPHSIFDRLEKTQSKLNVYEALQSITNFKDIELQTGVEKVCEMCFKNTTAVIRFHEMCNKSASYFKLYMQYQEINNVSESKIPHNEISVEGLILPKLHMRSEVLSTTLNYDDEQNVALTSMAIKESLNRTVETPIFVMVEDVEQITIPTTRTETLKSINKPINHEEQITIGGVCKAKCETYIDRLLPTELTDANVLSIKPEVLTDHEEQEVKISPGIPRITTGNTLSNTMETTIIKKEEIEITNIEPCVEKLCTKEKLLIDEIDQDVKMEIWPEFPTISTEDTLSSTTETLICEKEETIIENKAIRNENDEEIIDNGARRVKCKICNRFYRRDYVLIHLRIHTDERPYSCEICGKKFKNPSAKSIHKQTHNDQHECKVCGKKFIISTYLKQHLSVHSDERPFACEKCGKCFPSKKHLRQHMISHSEVRRHECHLCGKLFKQRDKLKTHLSGRCKGTSCYS